MSGSLWKKNLSLRRESEGEATYPEAPATPDAAVPEPEPTDIPPLPAASGDYGWLTASFDPNSVPDEMPVVTAPAVSVPERMAQPLAEVVHVPVVEEPAADTPVEAADPATGTPFWKKELSLKRGPKEPKAPKAPKQAKEPKAARAPKAAKTKAAKEPKTDAVPFWKKELGSRKPKQPKEAAAVAEPTAAVAEATEPKQPFWKKELGRSTQTAAPDAPTVETPKVKKPPVWKRELKLSKPKLERSPKQKTLKQPRQKAPRNVGNSKTGVVGLKIGASQVAAARVTNNGSPELVQIARQPLPDGVVVGGELRDVEGLAQALKELFGKNKLPKRGVRLGIANNRIGVRTFEIVGIDDPKQLANAIRFRAQETLPIPLEEAVLDWQVLSETVDEETGQLRRRVLLVVAYRELVDRYVDACKRAGIRLAGIDLEAFAMLRALALPAPAEGVPAAAQVVVNVGHDRSTFAVSDGRVCEFTRVLGWGGQSLSVAIARALDKTPSEVTEIKHALSLVAQFAPPEGISTETLDTAREAVRRELQSFARELVSSLRFYQNQPGSLGIGELVLTGGTAHLPGLSDELHRLIGVPVRVGDPLNRVAIPKKFREPEYALGSLTVAIGLGIED
jgi:type IV pilus assembly protein PilM